MAKKIKKKKLTPLQVITEWEKLPKKKRSARLGREFAKKAGMRSMGEVYCAADMDRQKIPYEYEPDKLRYTIDATYTPDFLVKIGDVYVEFKGKMVGTTRTKIRAIIRSNPQIRYCMVFQRANNKLSSKSKSLQYWQWCERYKIPWAEGTIKKEWLTDKFWQERKTI